MFNKSLFHSFSVAHVSYIRQLLFNYDRGLLRRCTLISTANSSSIKNLKAVNKYFQQPINMSKYTIVEKGAVNSTNYAVYFKNEEGQVISPLHDIPLYANKDKTILNMVVEIPRWTNAKMEITLKDPLNPIKQDIKKNKLRFVANCFPHKGYIWNYGAFPQTWENPENIEPSTGCKGDNDPIDVCEIGHRVANRGDIIQVKVLGTIALIDEGETDWKILAIDVNDPLADKMNDLSDIEKLCPGLIRATVEWFKIYKIPDGKPENQFAFNGEGKNAAFATQVVTETHGYWQKLVEDNAEGNIISRVNTTLKDSKFCISAAEAEKILDEAPEGGEVQEISESVNKWHWVNMK